MKIKVTKADGVDNLLLLGELTAVSDNWPMKITLDRLTEDGRQECIVESDRADYLVIQQLQWIVSESENIESIETTLEIQ